MNRPNLRTITLAAMTSLSGAVLGSVVLQQGACAFPAPAESPHDSVCGAVADYVQGCRGSSACVSAFTTDCDKISAGISAATFNSLFSCARESRCVNSGNALADCLGTAAGGLTPAQTQLAADYCAMCAPADPKCVGSFGTAAEVSLHPVSILWISDPLTKTIDSTCTHAAASDAGAGCEAAFIACAAPIIQSGVYLPEACAGDFGPPPESSAKSGSIDAGSDVTGD